MKTDTPPENPFLNLLVNILLPVLVLNKGSHYMDARSALFLALCFPLVYGAQDFIRRRHKNYVSILGIFNILLTGSLAIMKLTGIWFAAKEAVLPAILGVLVLGSSWTKNPAARMLFCNPQILNMALVEERLAARTQDSAYLALLRQTTQWLSLSFFLSAAANFAIGYRIFTKIDLSLPEAMQSQLLNEQIAKMVWTAFAVVALPLMVFSGILIYRFLHRLAKLTDLPVDDLMKKT